MKPYNNRSEKYLSLQKQIHFHYEYLWDFNSAISYEHWVVCPNFSSNFSNFFFAKIWGKCRKKHIIGMCGWFSKDLSRVQITISISVQYIKINTKNACRNIILGHFVRMHIIEVRLPSFSSPSYERRKGQRPILAIL